MTDTPKSIRLADELDRVYGYPDTNAAANELRRLKTENELLWTYISDALTQSEQLLEVLTEIDNWLVCAAITTPEDMAGSFQYMQELASAAIAKATGEAT